MTLQAANYENATDHEKVKYYTKYQVIFEI